jgi:hypothetical protein
MAVALSARRPDFQRLQYDLEMAIQEFISKVQAKQRLIADLGNSSVVTLRDRTEFLTALNTEREAYRGMQDLEQQCLSILREEFEGKR